MDTFLSRCGRMPPEKFFVIYFMMSDSNIQEITL